MVNTTARTSGATTRETRRTERKLTTSNATITKPPIKASITFEYTAYAYYPKLDESRVEPLPADWNGAYLGERLPHIKFTPEIVAKTKEIVGDETNPLVKARTIFHWVSDNIPWNAEHEYCVIPRSLTIFRMNLGSSR